MINQSNQQADKQQHADGEEMRPYTDTHTHSNTPIHCYLFFSHMICRKKKTSGAL